jgi:hypothetical protein
MTHIKFELDEEIFHSNFEEDKAYIVGWLKDKQLTHEDVLFTKDKEDGTLRLKARRYLKLEF